MSIHMLESKFYQVKLISHIACTRKENKFELIHDNALGIKPIHCCLYEFRYHSMYQWEDGTIAYFLKGKKFESFSACGIFNNRKVKLVDCETPWINDFLCEGDEEKDYVDTGGHGAQGIDFSRPRNTSIHFMRVICPSGHWTHQFLACDLQSVCWHSNSFGKSSGSDGRRKIAAQCQSPLSTLFTCRKSGEHVPYSLVCDHSHDCMDASDEDFCSYPSCLGSWQFECTNKQVKKHKGRSKQTIILFYSILGCVLSLPSARDLPQYHFSKDVYGHITAPTSFICQPVF